MAEAVGTGFTPAEARRLARLLKRLAPDAPPANAGEERLLRRAVAAGLAEWSDGAFHPRPEARNFLRRIFAADGEAAFASQHGERVAAQMPGPEGRRVTVTRNLDESPLSHLSRLRGRDGHAFLPEDAVAAGERLLADFTRGQLQPRVTASWEPRLAQRGRGAPGGQAELKDAALAARARFTRAVEAMGPELCGVALDICCFHKGLETVERERQWPARSAKLMLRTALMVLARHYAPPLRRASATRHWGADDYRPGMEGRGA
ncbi:DUF6456 domain-containing protein [Rhizobiaceae bacterium BDR2-2]|uniref:DUF6456 domain-containing protein n=1 Tax=Ectorhizobium quercum TaxID=2965071 RepID=A0AAE3N390_9HYPH|nr:DUF6456 domain-containing protein [Ectorhizobium quercum]MCX8998490.1 DUF6456 domain-containing protein [Ectorhizobium quercum]